MIQIEEKQMMEYSNTHEYTLMVRRKKDMHLHVLVGKDASTMGSFLGSSQVEQESLKRKVESLESSIAKMPRTGIS